MKKVSKIPPPCITIQGTIHVHTKGFAFVSPDDYEKYPYDIFIPKHLKGNAVDGDRVAIFVNIHKKGDKGPEGQVQSILKRGRDTFVGIVWTTSSKNEPLLYIPSLGKSKYGLIEQQGEKKYEIGERIIVKVIDWGKEKEPLLCKVMEKIGPIDDPSTDIPATLKEFGIRQQFSQEVLDQVNTFSKNVPKQDLNGRRDFTQLETFTIDPETARDFDDALSLTEDAQGHFHLIVHIADVSHYVKEKTPLDEEAKYRSNSTYFPGTCIPMLPEALSNHLCSLKENVIRLTISVIIELSPDGAVLKYEIVQGFIKSQKRYTYQEAKDILDKKRPSPHYETLKRMEKLCILLKKKRFERGSIDLALSDVVIQVDQKGKPIGYQIVSYDITHQLVEEFMLKANELVAEEFTKRGQKSVFRIHNSPTEENLAPFYDLAQNLGFSFSQKKDFSEIQKVFELAKQTPYTEQLAIAYIRSMKLAMYSRENVGHYGLALENYCHFTSPIRRYSDLIVHRLLFSKRANNQIDGANLDQIARQCSEKERISFKAEVAITTMKKLRLLKAYQAKTPKRIYSAIVTKIKPFGVFFEVSPLQCEGFLHISDLNDDYYLYQMHALVGQHSRKEYKVGSPLDLYLEQVDLILMESRWTLIQSKKKKKSSRPPSIKEKKRFKSEKSS